MPSIEQTLLGATQVSPADIARAKSRRQEMGGSLETALLELGLISEADLAPALSAHYGLPAVSADDLRDIPELTRALLSQQQAGAYQAVPFAAATGRVDLAVSSSPGVEQIDELAFLLGRRVRLFIVNDVRVAQGLNRAYRLSQPARLLNLADRLDRGLGLSSDLASDPLPEPPPSVLAGTFGTQTAAAASSRSTSFSRRPTPNKPRETLKTISLSDQERLAIFGSPEPSPPQPEESAVQLPVSDLARLSNRLQAATSPTAVGEAFLDYFERFARVALLLRPEGELFRGWMARGTTMPRGELRAIMTGPGLAGEWRQLLDEHDLLDVEIGASAVACGVVEPLALVAGDIATLVPIRVQGRIVCLAVITLARELEHNEKELIANASLRTGLALQSWILRQKGHPKNSG